MTDLFDDVPIGWECNHCGFAGYATQSQMRTHRCYGKDDDLDIRITQFLNRWTWRQDTATVRAELEALIDAAKHHAMREMKP